MSWDDLRSYAQAANDLSGIARARLAEAVRDALRGEVERVGASLGLAGMEEVARLRRTVERLERRVGALEAATGTGSPADRPARRPASARSRTGAPRSTRPAGAGGPVRAGLPGAVPGTTPGTTDEPVQDVPGTEVPRPPASPARASVAAPAGARTPVRRPRAAADAAAEAPAEPAVDEGSAP